MNKNKKNRGFTQAPASKKSGAGFTLIEILVVIGIIAILAAVVLIAINPARQFAQARNSQRISNVNAFINAYGQRMADHKGLFHGDTTTDPNCQVDIPTTAVDLSTAADICKTGTVVTSCPASSVDLRQCLVTDYISEFSVDPSKGSACTDATCGSGYDTQYVIYKDSTSKRITVSVPVANQELGQAISITR